jgi:hypothetical protein
VSTTQNCDNQSRQEESVTDLPLTAEQAEQTKGGVQECATHEGQFMGNLFSATPVTR